MPEPAGRYSSTFPWELELISVLSHQEDASAHRRNSVSQGSQERAAHPNIPTTPDLATLTSFAARKYSKPTGWEDKSNRSKKQKL